MESEPKPEPGAFVKGIPRKEYMREYMRWYYRAKPWKRRRDEASREYTRNWRKRNPERYKALTDRWNEIRRFRKQEEKSNGKVLRINHEP